MKNSPVTEVPSPLVRRLRTAGPLVGLTMLTLSLAACGGGSSTPSAEAPAPSAAATTANPADVALVPFVYDGQDYTWTDTGTTVAPMALNTGNNDLSTQSWNSATSGWGPVEKNMSNGEKGAGDGKTLTLGGKTYSTGLGVHSASQIVYNLSSQCSTFQSDIGLDDEVRSLGSVTFEVWADGSKLYDSGKMTGGQARKSISVDVSGKNELKLIVTNGGDNMNYDHADWAGATLQGCSATAAWSTNATENQSFTLAVRSTVRYGNGSAWTQQVMDAGTYTCNNKTFTDPAVGTVKHCEIAAVAPTAATSTVTYSGPLVITKGGTYTGNWESQDPNVAVITVQTSDPVIIENSNVRGKQYLITGWKNRLTIRNSNFTGLNPNVYDKIGGHFINIGSPLNLVVENNTIEGTQGLYINSFAGDASKGETIKILRNKFKNVNGLHSNGNNGYDFSKPDGFAHMIQFNNVRRIANADIGWNQVINEPGKSQVEENINMYVSSGTPSSPILIHDNYIQGAYSTQPSVRTGYAGGGILIGDGVVSNPLDGGYTKVYNNQIVSTTNEGLAISGGVENHVYNNRVISSGLLPDGSRNIAQNVGMYIWDVNKAADASPATFGNNTMENNYVAWTRVNADGSSWANPWWVPSCTTNNSSCNGNTSGGKATLDTEKQEYQLWLNKLASNGVKVGN